MLPILYFCIIVVVLGCHGEIIVFAVVYRKAVYNKYNLEPVSLSKHLEVVAPRLEDSSNVDWTVSGYEMAI